MIDRLTIPRPDDWHLHLRDGAALRDTVAASARHFGRVIVMPNLKPPVTTTAAALAYRQRILDARPPGARAFDPRMTLYLTDETGVDELARARASGVVDGVKLYPAGATTHSAAGVRDLAGRLPIFAAMAELGLPLLVHAEVVDADVDVFDRERVFLERELAPICAHVPGLRVVVEHITTSDGVDFVRAHDGVAATITAHHLLLNRNALLVGGVQPHHYCLPVLKRERHRQALVKAAKSGDPRFFLGTDSAPHARGAKEAACGCAGCYTAPHALALYAEAFDQVGALGRLEGFASHHGPWFYGHPVARETVTLVREACPVPATYALGDDVVVPLRAGGEVGWRVLDE